MGVGASKRLSAVNWGIVSEMSLAWILTFRAAAFGVFDDKAFMLIFDGSQLLGASRVMNDVRELDLEVCRCLSDNGLAVVPIPPASCATMRDGELEHVDLSIFHRYMDREMVPVTYGDVAWDGIKGLSICSGDQMMMALAREFLPPIEREDIVSLSHELDDVVDALDEIMQRIYMYNVRSIRPETLEFTDLIIRCCNALAEAAQEFRNFKRSKTLASKLVEVNNLEGEGDTLHSKYTRKLFCEKNSELDIIVWMNLFEGLEMCFDKCERATDLMEGVILKNS